MSEDQKLTGKEHAARAVSGGAQGILDTAVPSVAAGVGILAMSPYLRKVLQDTSHVPEGLKTDTVEKLTNLADRLSRVGGRNPDVGRPLELHVAGTPGYANVVREPWRKRTQAVARDVLELGLGATPESVAHEIGHVTHGNRFGKAVSNISPFLRSRLAQAAPSVLAATALLGDPDKEAPMIAKAAPYIGGAQLAGILGDEVRATNRGMKLLKHIGYNPTLKQKFQRHALAIPTLGRAALLIGAPMGILAGIKAYDKARKLGRPMPLPSLLTQRPTELADAPSSMELQKKWAPLFNKR